MLGVTTDRLERVKERAPVKPLPISQTTIHNDGTLTKEEQIARRKLFAILSESNSPELIWKTFCQAMDTSITLPRPLIDRVSRVVIRTYAPKRETFLRLHSIITHLRNSDHQVYTWQWNALVYHAALGRRKVRTQDYRAALDVYREMLSHLPHLDSGAKSSPDTITYTTLLSIAIRTGSGELVEHAHSLFRSSQTAEDRIARIAIIPYYARIKYLKAIVRIARHFADTKEDIGIDGINSYLWAFGRWGHLDVVRSIYDALRRNLPSVPENIDEVDSPMMPLFDAEMDGLFDEQSEEPKTKRKETTPKDSPTDSEDILEPDGIQPISRSSTKRVNRKQSVHGNLIIWPQHVPDSITYTMCVQIFAYNGKLREAMTIFLDMLNTPNREQRWDGHSSVNYRPLHKTHRAMFLGFVRYARQMKNIRRIDRENDPAWCLEALRAVFDSFLNMDEDQFGPNDRLVLWIMDAFALYSKNDNTLLVWVWTSLTNRFGPLRPLRRYEHIIAQCS